MHIYIYIYIYICIVVGDPLLRRGKKLFPKAINIFAVNILWIIRKFNKKNHRLIAFLKLFGNGI